MSPVHGILTAAVHWRGVAALIRRVALWGVAEQSSGGRVENEFAQAVVAEADPHPTQGVPNVTCVKKPRSRQTLRGSNGAFLRASGRSGMLEPAGAAALGVFTFK